MQHNIINSQPTPHPDRTMRIIVAVVISLVIVIITAVAAVILLLELQKNAVPDHVKDELNKVVQVMESKRQSIGAYPSTITDILALSSDDVKLNGGSSFDGTSYCITGTSVSDESIVFHINSAKSAQGPQAGDCETGADISVPSTPGDLAIAFVTSTEIKITWGLTTSATSYVLQCSADSNYSSPRVVNVTDVAGVCEKLKSNTTYYYRVKAINSAGASAWSSISNIKTPSR